MPFDFKKYNEKCNGLTAEELQREWQHYTRLITGAATSTTVSGLALPLTAGVSSIGIALAAPAIHNARKKREIVEMHLNRQNLTHVTRKRDVLGGVAVSGTIGVVTLGIGTLGADAIAAQGAEHGISAIVENDTAIKIVTHAALDGVGLGVEHAHTSHVRKREARKAFQAAGVFQTVADAKAAEAGYAAPGYAYNNPEQSFATSSSNQPYFPPPPPAYSPGPAPSSHENLPTYHNLSDTQPTTYDYSQTTQPAYYPQYPMGDTKNPSDFAPQIVTTYQQAPAPAYPAPYSAVPSPPASSGQEFAPGMFDMKIVAEALPSSSVAPEVGLPHQETTRETPQEFALGTTSNDSTAQPMHYVKPSDTGSQGSADTSGQHQHQPGGPGSFAPAPSQLPSMEHPSAVGTHGVYSIDPPRNDGHWSGQPPQQQAVAQGNYNTVQVAQQGITYGQMPPTPPMSTPSTTGTQYTESPVGQSYVVSPQYGHSATHSQAYFPVTASHTPQPTLIPPSHAPTPQPQAPATTHIQYYQNPSVSRYEPVAIPQAYNHSRPQSQIYQSTPQPQLYQPKPQPQLYQTRPQSQLYPPTPQSLPMTPLGPSYHTNNSTCYFPPPPTGH